MSSPSKKRKRRKIKKYSVKWWHNRLDPKFSSMITEVQKCAVCHRRNGQFHPSHIYPKGTYQGLRYDPINALCMCGQCHKFWWHLNPLDAYEWFREKYPNRYIYLQEAKKIIVKRNREYYEKVDKALDEKNIKDLFILPVDKIENL